MWQCGIVQAGQQADFYLLRGRNRRTTSGQSFFRFESRSRASLDPEALRAARAARARDLYMSSVVTASNDTVDNSPRPLARGVWNRNKQTRI